MRELVRQYKKAGYKVIGTAPSSAAAQSLAKATGIEVKNLSLLCKDWQISLGEEFELALRSDYYKEAQYQHDTHILNKKTVLIVDEASMVELANMDYIVSEVKRSGAKLVLVGDNNQFAAVGHTGGFKKATIVASSNKLTEIRRHVHSNSEIQEQYRSATKLMGQYKMREALEIYDKLDVFRIAENADSMKSALVTDYVSEYLEQASKLDREDIASIRSIVIGAYTNTMVNHFNIEVRERLKQAGVLKGKDMQFRSGKDLVALRKGEQIVFETNNAAWDGFNGVLNGEVATVIDFEEVDEFGIGTFKALVHKADGRKQVLRINNAGKYPLRFKHGYAVTGYKLQGETVDHIVQRMVELFDR
jgi:ATP-dependent exoDNAse (exonuclease V) alpha subunit